MGRCRVTIHFRNPCIAKKGGVSTVARFFWWISVQRPTLSDNNPIKVIDPPPPPQIYNILQKVIIHPQFVKISPEILYFIMSIYAFFVPISISVCQNWRVDRAGGKPILAMPRFRKILVTLPFPYGVSESVTDAGTQWSDLGPIKMMMRVEWGMWLTSIWLKIPGRYEESDRQPSDFHYQQGLCWELLPPTAGQRFHLCQSFHQIKFD